MSSSIKDESGEASSSASKLDGVGDWKGVCLEEGRREAGEERWSWETLRGTCEVVLSHYVSPKLVVSVSKQSLVDDVCRGGWSIKSLNQPFEGPFVVRLRLGAVT